jgi:hypothetical protein
VSDFLLSGLCPSERRDTPSWLVGCGLLCWAPHPLASPSSPLSLLPVSTHVFCKYCLCLAVALALDCHVSTPGYLAIKNREATANIFGPCPDTVLVVGTVPPQYAIQPSTVQSGTVQRSALSSAYGVVQYPLPGGQGGFARGVGPENRQRKLCFAMVQVQGSVVQGKGVEEEKTGTSVSCENEVHFC